MTTRAEPLGTHIEQPQSNQKRSKQSKRYSTLAKRSNVSMDLSVALRSTNTGRHICRHHRLPKWFVFQQFLLTKLEPIVQRLPSSACLASTSRRIIIIAAQKPTTMVLMPISSRRI
jgi:hypothetical protein